MTRHVVVTGARTGELPVACAHAVHGYGQGAGGSYQMTRT